MSVKMLLLSIVPYTLSNWLIWQNLKDGTSLPCGNVSCKYGLIIGWSIKFLYFVYFSIFCINHGWINLLTFPFTWFVSGWLATALERKLYMIKVMEVIKWNAEQYANSSPAFAIAMVSVPGWWLDLMPRHWKKDYYTILQRFAE